MRPEEQSQSHQQQAEAQPANGSMAELKFYPTFEKICCPECGGTRVRTYNGFVSILVAVAGMVSILFLQNVFVLLPFNRYMQILSFGMMFLICAACIFVWMLLFRNSLCKSCGYSFRSLTDSEQKKTRIPFPWRFCVLNCILLFFLGLTLPGLLEVLFHEKFVYFLIKIAFVIFSIGFFVGLSLVYQAVIHTFLRDKIRNRFLWAILFVMPVILLGSYDLYNSLPRVRAARILSYGRLADLPESVSNIKVYSWSFFFSGEWYLRFQASPEDIEKFINNTPSLNGQEYIEYSPEKMKIPLTRDKEKMEELRKAGHEIYLHYNLAPKWYRPDIRVRGREYEVPPLEERRHNWGEVIVDDEKNIVYIKIIWS